MKQKFCALVLAMYLFGSIGLNAQTWVPHSADSNLQGVYNLRQFILHGSEMYTFTDKTWYRCSDFSNAWEEPQQAGLSSGQQLYNKGFELNDTLFTVTQFGEWFYSIDSVNTWIPFTAAGMVPIAHFAPIKFHKLAEKVVAEYNGSSYYTTDGFNWSAVPFTADYYRILSDSIIRACIPSTSDYILYDSDFVPYDTLYSEGFTGMGQDVVGHFVYTISLGTDSVYRRNLCIENPPLEGIGALINDTMLNLCGVLTYTVSGNFQIITGRYTSSTLNETVWQYASSDGGATWSARPDLKWLGFESPIALSLDSLVAYDYFNANYRYSVDGGATWTVFDNQVFGLSYYKIPFSITGDTLLWYKTPPIGSYHFAHGIYRSLDGGLSWELASNGMPIITSGTDTTVPSHSRAIGPYRYSSTYMVWLEDIYKMYYTTDAGSNWSLSLAPAPWADAVGYSGRDDDEIFFLAYDANLNVLHFYRTSDGGVTWTPTNVPRGDSAVPGQYFSNHIIQGQHDTLLCRYEQWDNAAYTNQLFVHRLYLSTDDGITWTEITPPSIAGNPDRILDMGDYLANQEVRIAYTSRTDQFMMVTKLVDSISDRPHYSPLVLQDSLLWFDGTNWSVIQHTGLPSDIDIQSLFFDGTDFYLGSNYGVYLSSDTGLTWSQSSLRLAQPTVQANSGLTGRLEMYSLNIFTTSIIVGTNANGLWRYDLGPLANEEISTTNSPELNAFPVPVSADGNVFWSLDQSADNVIVEVKDIRGAVISTSTYSDYTAGAVYSESMEGVATGVYFMSVTADGATQTQKLVVE